MKTISFAASIGLFAAALPASAAPASIEGRWKTDDGNAIVEIARCGSALCGTVSKFLVAEPVGGVRDTKNPDKAKRDRKVLGSRIFWQLTPDGSGWSGKGYSPQDGRYFDAALTKKGGKLEIRGCVMVFCRTKTFTPA